MQRRISSLVTLITSSKRAITISAFVIFSALALLKFFLVRALLSMGVPREALQAQDAIITGALTAALVWLLLMAVHVRHSQEEEQIRVVAGLNHDVRNAMEVILYSEHLPSTEKAAAILESIARIDRALRILLPPPKMQNP